MVSDEMPDPEAFREMANLYGNIIETLILKGANKNVLDKTWHEIGERIIRYVEHPSQKGADNLLNDLKARYKNLSDSDEEDVRSLDKLIK